MISEYLVDQTPIGDPEDPEWEDDDADEEDEDDEEEPLRISHC
ncbi:MAG TPA: hypothetical protein VGL25_00140 [Casimicrobiaceae bacterium]|jgi:hypothetical protein